MYVRGFSHCSLPDFFYCVCMFVNYKFREKGGECERERERERGKVVREIEEKGDSYNTN